MIKDPNEYWYHLQYIFLARFTREIEERQISHSDISGINVLYEYDSKTRRHVWIGTFDYNNGKVIGVSIDTPRVKYKDIRESLQTELEKVCRGDYSRVEEAENLMRESKGLPLL